MEPQLFCQSCTMPIDDINDRGTEKDGTKSIVYCRYCYQDGAFKEPGMTYEEMKSNVVKQMHELKLSEDVIKKSLNSLSQLKRWKIGANS